MMGGRKQAVEAFQCPVCLRVSYNLNDIRNRYCGACHLGLDDYVADDIACGRCAAPVRTFWMKNDTGMVPSRHVTLVADSVFHTACWNTLVIESPPGTPSGICP